MYTYPGHPEEEIEFAGYCQHQNQQRKVSVGRCINQFFETRRLATAPPSHEAHNHGEGGDCAEHRTDSQRERGRCRIGPGQTEADAGETATSNQPVTHKVEPLPKRDSL